MYADDNRREVAWRLHHLQATEAEARGQPHYALSDFHRAARPGVADWVGAFVTAGIGLDEKVREFEARHDDYGAIMLKAPRTAWPRRARRAHARAVRASSGATPTNASRTTTWSGEISWIRPAPGYPACPTTPRRPRWEDARRRAQHHPADRGLARCTWTAAVSGWYFAPESTYRGWQGGGRTRVADYARRRASPSPEAERWLAPVIGWAGGGGRGLTRVRRFATHAQGAATEAVRECVTPTTEPEAIRPRCRCSSQSPGRRPRRGCRPTIACSCGSPGGRSRRRRRRCRSPWRVSFAVSALCPGPESGADRDRAAAEVQRVEIDRRIGVPPIFLLPETTCVITPPAWRRARRAGADQMSDASLARIRLPTCRCLRRTPLT